jgi:hypothetical protein
MLDGVPSTFFVGDGGTAAVAILGLPTPTTRRRTPAAHYGNGGIRQNFG